MNRFCEVCEHRRTCELPPPDGGECERFLHFAVALRNRQLERTLERGRGDRDWQNPRRRVGLPQR